jgi:hypothetical protein
MSWTAGLILQTIAGFIGAHIAAIALPEYWFGWARHSLVGLLAGSLSGGLLQTTALTLVNGSGGMNEPRLAEAAAIEVLMGAALGAMAMAVVGFLLNVLSGKA